MDAREHILETAISLFYSRGCKAVTMDEIASEAGISKRTLYEHFSDKEALLEAGIQWWNKKAQDAMEVITKEAENTLDILLRVHHFQSEQMVKMSIDLISDIKKYYPQVFKNSVLASREQHRHRTKAFLLRGQAEGIFRADINIDLINDLLELMFYMIHDNNKALVQKYSYEEFFRCTTICFVRGISTEKGLNYMEQHYGKKKRYDNTM
ncbi:MAG: TetR/AcrR family transcriptional regulator [Prevotellaceae bacterium]|jgi:AcrR family transcriptional regulator|nr:TetR/AcrR family transcriptional regulator [Prevotellaceae bacterium]